MGGVRSGHAFRARGFAALCAALIMAAGLGGPPAQAWMAPQFSVIYTFTAPPFTGEPPPPFDSAPNSLLTDKSGALYGTAATVSDTLLPCSSVFKLAPPVPPATQ